MKEVGKSSVVFDTCLYDGDTGTRLGRNLLKFVQINTQTRRPQPFPDWFHTKFAHLPVTGRITELNKSILPETPDNCFNGQLLLDIVT